MSLRQTDRIKETSEEEGRPISTMRIYVNTGPAQLHNIHYLPWNFSSRTEAEIQTHCNSETSSSVRYLSLGFLAFVSLNAMLEVHVPESYIYTTYITLPFELGHIFFTLRNQQTEVNAIFQIFNQLKIGGNAKNLARYKNTVSSAMWLQAVSLAAIHYSYNC